MAGYSVLHLTDFSAEFPGTFVDSLQRLASRVAADNVRLILVFPRYRSWQDTMSNENISMVHLPSPGLKSPFRFVSLLFQVRRLLLLENVRVIHCHFGKDSKIFAVVLKILFDRNLRIVWHWHGMPATMVEKRSNVAKRLFRDIFYRLAGHWVDRHVAICTEMYDWLTRISEKVSFVPNGISLERFTKDNLGIAALEQTRQRYGITQSFFVVCSVANFRPEKDHVTLLKAAKEVLHHRKDSVFILVGDGPTRRQTEMLAQSLGIKERVIFAGLRIDVEKIVSISDAFVLSTHHEGFGYTLCEAMALEKPVIATRVGGCTDVVTQGTGFLVTPCDYGEMAEKILWLRDNPERAIEMGRCGRIRVEQNYDLNLWTARIRELYLELFKR